MEEFADFLMCGRREVQARRRRRRRRFLHDIQADPGQARSQERGPRLFIGREIFYELVISLDARLRGQERGREPMGASRVSSLLVNGVSVLFQASRAPSP